VYQILWSIVKFFFCLIFSLKMVLSVKRARPFAASLCLNACGSMLTNGHRCETSRVNACGSMLTNGHRCETSQVAGLNGYIAKGVSCSWECFMFIIQGFFKKCIQNIVLRYCGRFGTILNSILDQCEIYKPNQRSPVFCTRGHGTKSGNQSENCKSI